METQRHYNRAPIREAVIDIRADLPSDVTLEVLSSIQVAQKELYPEFQNRYQLEVQGEMGASFTMNTRHAQLGYVSRNKDQTQIFQARLDGFTFSRLAPYE